MPDGETPNRLSAEDVPFPYDRPYEQQLQLMQAVLDGLDGHRQDGDNPDGNCSETKTRVLLLESPTGTGKSLSLACSSIAWLKRQEEADLGRTKAQKASTRHRTDRRLPSDPDCESSRHIRTATEARSQLQTYLGRLRTSIRVAYEDERDSTATNKQQEHHNRVRGLRSALHQLRSNGRCPKNRRLSNTPKQRRGAEDFCLPDYEDGCTATKANTATRHASSLTNNIVDHNFAQARLLLDGARLDGSCDTDIQRDNPNIVGSTSGSAPASLPKRQTVATVASVQPNNGVRKILYAARTHSQLSQFLAEVRKTHWGSSIRAIALGSRSTAGVCGYLAKQSKTFNGPNKKSDAHWTETCLDLQKGKPDKKHLPSASSGCPYRANPDAVSTLALHLLTQPTDIEETARLGQAVQTCAYYASREAIAAAEVIALPYSMLVSKETRDSLHLSLHNNVVIIDEAHNLSEVMTSMFSATLTVTVVEAANEQLQKYVQKYLQRLGSRNLHFLRQLAMICQSILRFLRKSSKKQPRSNDTAFQARLISSFEWLMELKLTSINLYPLIRYMKETRLSQKLLGFMNHQCSTQDLRPDDGNRERHSSFMSKHVSPMSFVEKFLQKLSGTSQHGKILTDFEAGVPQVRYVLLHPSEYCRDLLEQPHAVCLVGGTLRPFGHLASELFGSLADDSSLSEPVNQDLLRAACEADQYFARRLQNIVTAGDGNDGNDHMGGCGCQSPLASSSALHRDRLTSFSCSHVVSPTNVLLQSIGRVDSTVIDLRHAHRSKPAVQRALGVTLVQLCQSIPNGVVVFLPSYKYESELLSFWQTEPVDHTGVTVMQKLQSLKSLFREPKSSSEVETVLNAYSEAARERKGALLVSVVGGKLSEGINFADELGRGVVVVGLPYADITDPVLREKMRLLDEHGRGNSALSSRAYYHNLCMRAVNQSIGRAIRHAHDYAAIVLLDQRYQTDSRVVRHLPEWLMASGMQHGFDSEQLSRFFRERSAQYGDGRT